MKNVHILLTDKPSRLFIDDFGKLFNSINIDQEQNHFKPQHIYITSSDEEIKEGDWFYDGDGDLCKYTSDYVVNPNGWNDNKKIILTTDQDLIKDGVQAIDDEFLEWFVKNPSCEEVKIVKYDGYLHFKYMIIPKEEQKQHLIDMMKGDEELGLYENWVEDAEKESTLSDLNSKAKIFWIGYKVGVKSKERMYSDMKNIKIKITKEQSDLFKHTGNIVSLSNGDVYMNIPYWLKETDKENVYEHLTIEQLPDDIKNERMYSEEDLRLAWEDGREFEDDHNGGEGGEFTGAESFDEWFEQFKKKTQ